MNLKTIDRYIGSQFLRMFFLCLFAFVIIYLMIDFIERSSPIFKKDPALIWVAAYFAFKIPVIFFQMMPVACLLGSLLSLTILAKNSELVAVKAGGIPILRATASIFVLAFSISILSFLINEFVSPAANLKKDYIYKVHIKKQEWRAKYRKKNVFYRDGNSIFSFGLFVPEQSKIKDVRMYRFDTDFQLLERATAKSAEFHDGQWRLIDGSRWIFDHGDLTDTKSFDFLPIRLEENPEEMKVYQKDAEQMSFRELRAFIRNMERQGYDAQGYKVDLHSKFSFPLIGFIMAILGIPFAVRIGRSGGIATGIGVSVVIGVIYWIIMAWSLTLGRSGVLPPVIAAWGSHAIFGIGGVVLLSKVRQ